MGTETVVIVTAMAHNVNDVDLEGDADETRIPTAVLGPAAFFAAVGLPAAALGVYGLVAGPQMRGTSITFLAAGLVLTALAVGLYRRSRLAHALAHLVCVPIGLTIIGLVVAVPIVWCLQTRQGKDWFGIR